MNTKRLVVLGGSGFVGRAICREGIRRGWIVTSLSRRGIPTGLDSLLEKVNWTKGSALDPSSYGGLLEGQDYLVHAIGTLFESNPLYNLYKNQPVDYSASYKALIRDSLEIAMAEAIRKGVKGVGYISAARYGALGGMLLPKYMMMKEEAERLLIEQNNELRSVIVRPGFMFGSDRWATIPMSLGVTAMTLFTAGMMPKPICVDTVARAMLISLEDSKQRSTILEVPDILRVGTL